MRSTIFIVGVSFFLTNLMAEGLDMEIEIDESTNSSLLKQTKIIGCTDHTKRKENSCSKKAEDLILEKLPTSQQITEKAVESEESKEEIKDQLSSILSQLNQLKQAQKANQQTIDELRKIISVLSTKQVKNTKKSITSIQKSIQKIRKPHPSNARKTRIRHEIKEVSQNDVGVVIEVQNNESLSMYAQYYYNDNRKYYKIYKANRDKIKSDLQIIVGDHIVIPYSE